MSQFANPGITQQVIDLSMNNLNINTIWFGDGTSLTSAKGLIGPAGGLSFQYNVNLSTISEPTDALEDGKLILNALRQDQVTELYISKKTRVFDHQNSQSIDLEYLFNWINSRSDSSTVKGFLTVIKLGDNSKKIIYQVLRIEQSKKLEKIPRAPQMVIWYFLLLNNPTKILTYLKIALKLHL